MWGGVGFNGGRFGGVGKRMGGWIRFDGGRFGV